MIFTPRKPQRLGIEFLKQHARGCIFGDVGIGKTAIVATDILRCLLSGSATKALIVAPKGVLDTDVWPMELAKWDHTRHLTLAPINGKLENRRTALVSKADIHLINFELLPWLLMRIGHAWPYDYVVVDESTRLGAYDGVWFKGRPQRKTDALPGYTIELADGREVAVRPDTRRTLPMWSKIRPSFVDSKVPLSDEPAPLSWPYRPRLPAPEIVVLIQPAEPGLKHMIPHTRHWVNLTGTPSSDSLEPLWSQLFFIDQGARLGRNITEYRDTWFRPRRVFGYDPLPFAEIGIAEKIRDVCLTLKARDYLPVDEPTENTIRIAMPPGAMSLYRDLERTLFLNLQTGKIEAANAAVLSGKCRQVAAGAAYRDPDPASEAGAWTLIHDTKIEVLKSLLHEIQRPVIVVYDFKSSRQRLRAAGIKAKDFTSENNKLNLIRDFAAGKIPVLLVHPASAGHGIEGLQDGTDTMIFFDLSWSRQQHDQVVGRIGPTRQYQSGHPRPVMLHYLAMRDTIDELVIARWRTKQTVQEALLSHIAKAGETV